MSIATTLQKVEKSVEKEILAFFQLLGASEAPEEWECAHPPCPPSQDATDQQDTQAH